MNHWTDLVIRALNWGFGIVLLLIVLGAFAIG